jgi:hypothetical protein
MSSKKTKKTKGETVSLAPLDFESAIRATLATGKAPPAPKRRPKGKKMSKERRAEIAEKKRPLAEVLAKIKAWCDANPAPPDRPKRKLPSATNLRSKAVHLKATADLLERGGDMQRAKIMRAEADIFEQQALKIERSEQNQ